MPRIPSPPGGPAEGEQQSFDTTPDVPQVDYRIVDTPEALVALVSELDSTQGFSFDTETTGVDPMSADLVGLSFSTAPQTGWYVPVGHSEGRQLAMDDVLEALRSLFESEIVPKVAHNANYDMTVLKSHGVEVRGVTFDTMVAAALLGRRSIGLKQLALNELGIEMTELSDLIGTGRSQISMADVSIELAADYAAADADMTGQLHPRFEQELDAKNSTRPMQEVEIPLIPVLVRMQEIGVSVDADLLTRMSQELGDDLARIQDEMYQTVGRPFNLNSAQQLSDVLFNQLRLPPTKKRQRGFATDAASLEGLKSMLDAGRGGDVDPAAYEVLDHILNYRQLSKIKVYLYRFSPRSRQPKDRPHPHELQPSRLSHRSRVKQRPEHPEHPRPYGAWATRSARDSSLATGLNGHCLERTTRRSSFASSRTSHMTLPSFRPSTKGRTSTRPPRPWSTA